MKKVLLIGLVFVTVCCLSQIVIARPRNMNEYNWNVFEDLDRFERKARKVNPCSTDYPYTATQKEEIENAGGECNKNPKIIDGERCYSCTGDCNNEKIYPYSEEDCSGTGFEPVDPCVPTEGQPVKYKDCKCAEGFYKENELFGGEPNPAVFRYNVRKSATEKVTCYQAKRTDESGNPAEPCVSAKPPITKDDFTINIYDIDDIRAYYRGQLCTELKLQSFLQKIEDKNNIFCATAHNCRGACTSAGTLDCVQTETHNLDRWYNSGGTSCKYYTGCLTNSGHCTSGEIGADSPVYATKIKYTKYDPSNNSPGEDRYCYKTNGCKTTVTENFLYGPQNLKIEGELKEGVDPGILETPSTIDEETCSTYTCRDGWDNSTGGGGKITEEEASDFISTLKDYGEYKDIYYVQNKEGWFSCRKIEEAPNKTCFEHCSEVGGGWYKSEVDDCDTEGYMTNKIVIRKSERRVVLASLKDSEKTYADIQKMDVKNNLTLEDAEKIAGQLLTRYGENRCFVTKDGIYRLKSNGTLSFVPSEEEFALCEPLIWDPIPNCLERRSRHRCKICDAGSMTSRAGHWGCYVCETQGVNPDVVAKCSYSIARLNRTFKRDNPCGQALPNELFQVYACYHGKPCPSGCTGCTINAENQSNCTGCAEDYYLFNGKCYQQRISCQHNWNEDVGVCNVEDIGKYDWSSPNYSWNPGGTCDHWLNKIVIKAPSNAMISVERSDGRIVGGRMGSGDICLKRGKWTVSWTGVNNVWGVAEKLGEGKGFLPDCGSGSGSENEGEGAGGSGNDSGSEDEGEGTAGAGNDSGSEGEGEGGGAGNGNGSDDSGSGEYTSSACLIRAGSTHTECAPGLEKTGTLTGNSLIIDSDTLPVEIELLTDE